MKKIILLLSISLVTILSHAMEHHDILSEIVHAIKNGAVSVNKPFNHGPATYTAKYKGYELLAAQYYRHSDSYTYALFECNQFIEGTDGNDAKQMFTILKDQWNLEHPEEEHS